MKKDDITFVAVCAIVSGVLSLVLANIIFDSSSRQTQVEVVQEINPNFIQPDERYFNDTSFNPTQLIQIGNNANQQANQQQTEQ